MAIEFTVDHDHTYAGEEGIEPLIGWITFSVSTYPGDFRVREQGAGTPRTMNLPSRRGWLAADGHMYKDQSLEQPCRLVACDPAFNLRHLTYRADFELTTVLGDPVAVPLAYFPAPSTDTTLYLTRVMTDPAQPVMEVRGKVYVEDILDMDKDHISDILELTDVGYELVSATDAAAARRILGPAVFDARDYGVIADGAPHNNVANLLDCVAACVAAGGGEVMFPAGVIDTSEANLGAVISDSGNPYTNDGGIPLPADCPITFTGHGVGSTVLRQSKGFTRGFDFRWQANGENYRDITIRGITFDRDNLTAADIAPMTAVTSSVTIPADGSSVAAPGLSASVFRNAPWVMCPATNAGTANNIWLWASVTGDTVYLRNLIGTVDVTLNVDDEVGAVLADHVIVGTEVWGGFGYNGGNGASINNLLVEDCEAVNAVTVIGDGNAVTPDYSSGIGFWMWNRGGYQGKLTNFRCRNVKIYGGRFGFNIKGGTGTWLDEIWFENCLHDTLITPSTFGQGINYHIGQNAWVGRVGVINCVGRNSQDVGVEINQAWEGYVINTQLENTVSGFYRTNFVPPARTADGPPTQTLAASITDSATSCTLDTGIPADVSRNGLALITTDSTRELVWYQATNAAGTSLDISRGVNGTTAVAHSVDPVMTFVQVDKTRLYYSGVSSYNKDVLAGAAGDSVHAFTSYAQNNMPVPPITVRDSKITMSGGSLIEGRAVYWNGWCPDVDIQGLIYTHDSLSYTGSTARYVGAYGWYWDQGTDCYAKGVPAPRIYGRNNKVKATGKTSYSDAVYSAMRTGPGYALLDFDIDADIDFSGAGAGNIKGFLLRPGIPYLTLAPQSRVGIKLRARGNTKPIGVDVLATNVLTILDTIEVDADLSDAAYQAGGSDDNYCPWSINSTQVGKVRFRKITHAQQATNKFTASKRPVAAITADYTVSGSDEILLVDTSSGPVTLTLPQTAAGGAVGVPINRGRQIQVIDAGFNAATNNITIAPAATDRIDDKAIGASLVLKANGCQVTLSANPARPGWSTTAGILAVDGSELVRRNFQTVSTSTTIGTAGDYIVLVDASGAPTLPSASGLTGRTYTFKNVDAANTNKTISTTSSQTIDGSTTLTLTPYMSITVVSDGSNWKII